MWNGKLQITTPLIGSMRPMRMCVVWYEIRHKTASTTQPHTSQVPSVIVDVDDRMLITIPTSFYREPIISLCKPHLFASADERKHSQTKMSPFAGEEISRYSYEQVRTKPIHKFAIILHLWDYPFSETVGFLWRTDMIVQIIYCACCCYSRFTWMSCYAPKSGYAARNIPATTTTMIIHQQR